MAENNIPLHVGIIMDGNGRWAKKRLMPRSFGHKSGMNRMIGLLAGGIIYTIGGIIYAPKRSWTGFSGFSANISKPT